MSNIFQKIINKEVKSFILNENDKFITILDAYPVNPGHCLVIPKVSEINITRETKDIKRNILLEADFVISKLTEKLGAKGFKYIFNCEKLGGQEIMHTHLHIIPYYENDDIKNLSLEEIFKMIKN